MSVNNSWDKGEISEDIEKCTGLNENETTTYQNLWGPQRPCRAGNQSLQTLRLQENRPLHPGSHCYLKKLKKNKNKQMEITKMEIEIMKLKNSKSMGKKINEMTVWIFKESLESISLPKLTEVKRGEARHRPLMAGMNISPAPAAIKKIPREYHEHL